MLVSVVPVLVAGMRVFTFVFSPFGRGGFTGRELGDTVPVFTRTGDVFVVVDQVFVIGWVLYDVDQE